MKDYEGHPASYHGDPIFDDQGAEVLIGSRTTMGGVVIHMEDADLDQGPTVTVAYPADELGPACEERWTVASRYQDGPLTMADDEIENPTARSMS
jgi:hypothetical protein